MMCLRFCICERTGHVFHRWIETSHPPWQIARNSSFLFRAMYQCFREHRLRESTILFRSGLDNGRSALAARSA